jgi:hypothetical protein
LQAILYIGVVHINAEHVELNEVGSVTTGTHGFRFVFFFLRETNKKLWKFSPLLPFSSSILVIFFVSVSYLYIYLVHPFNLLSGVIGHWIKYVIFIVTMILYVWSLVAPMVLRSARQSNYETIADSDSEFSGSGREINSLTRVGK